MAEGGPTIEGPALVSDPKDREDQLSNAKGGRGGITRRQFIYLSPLVIGGVLAYLGLRGKEISVAEILGQKPEAETEAEKLKQREAEWIYLITGSGTGYYTPKILSQYGKGEGIDINQKETWANSRPALYFEGLSNFIYRLQTKEGRDQLAQIAIQVGERTGSTVIQDRAEVLDEKFGDKQYDEGELLNNFFGQELGYSPMELSIFRGALNLWRTGEATIEFEGKTTTFKDLVNRYNQENQIDVSPLP